MLRAESVFYVEEEPEYPEKEPQQACSVYRQNRNRYSLVFLGRQIAVVCSRRSKPLTNKLPRTCGGVQCFTGKSHFPPQNINTSIRCERRVPSNSALHFTLINCFRYPMRPILVLLTFSPFIQEVQRSVYCIVPLTSFT